MPLTVVQIIEQALREITALPLTQSASGNEIQAGVQRISQIIDQWSMEGIMIRTRTLETFALSRTRKEFTWGPGGDFDSPSPVEIYAARVNQGDVTYEVMPVGAKHWNDVQIRNVEAIPRFYWWEPGTELDTIRFNVFPTTPTISFVSAKPLPTEFELDEGTSFPRGMDTALVYELARRLAPLYGLDDVANQNITRRAFETKAAVEAYNSRPDQLQVDEGLLEGRIWRYDVTSGPG